MVTVVAWFARTWQVRVLDGSFDYGGASARRHALWFPFPARLQPRKPGDTYKGPHD